MPENKTGNTELRFWKLSQGIEYFSYQSMLETIESGLVYVHKDTKAKATLLKKQAQDFIDAPIGDYFYLTHGEEIKYHLQNSSDVECCVFRRRNGNKFLR